MPRRRPIAQARAFAALQSFLLFAVLSGCAAGPSPDASLYVRLGGASGVAAVVDRTIDRAAADPETRRSFADVKMKALKESIAQQICSLTGGGCQYEGETMVNAHRDAQIRASEFDALVQILREELDRQGIDTRAKNELLRLLAPMKRDIVASQGATVGPGR